MEGALMEKRGKQRRNTTKDDVSSGNASETEKANTSAGPASLEKILSELREFRQDNSLQLRDIKDELNKSNKRIEEAEQRIESAETRIQNTEEVVEELLKLQEHLVLRLNEQEGRSRRENIRIYGVPEGSEEKFPDVSAFLKHLLKSTLDLDPEFELQIERAHRALAPKPSDLAKPRSIVARFLSYKTKEAVIKQAWERRCIEWQGNRVLFDHDYAPDVLQRHRALQEAKRVLKENDIKFQTRFPAKLRVFYKEGTRIYNSAEEAERDMQERGFSITLTQPPTSLKERIQCVSWRKVGKNGGGAANRAMVNYKVRLSEE